MCTIIDVESRQFLDWNRTNRNIINSSYHFGFGLISSQFRIPRHSYISGLLKSYIIDKMYILYSGKLKEYLRFLVGRF